MKFLNSNIIKFILKLAVSVVLIYLIFKFVGINKVYNELVDINLLYIFISIFFTIFLIIFKAIRWKNIIGMFHTNLNIVSSIRYTLISIGFSLVTPGKVGEFIKVKYLTDKTGIRYLKSFITVVVDKGFDIVAMLFLALLGLSLLNEFADWSHLLISGFIIYLLILILILVFFDNVLKIIPYFLPTRYKGSLKRMVLTRKLYLESIILSLVIWIILSIQAFFIIKSLGVSVSFFMIISVVPLMALSSLIPISIGGIGVREVIAIFFFLLIGVTAEKSTVFSLLYTFITAGIPAITGTFLHLSYKKS